MPNTIHVQLADAVVTELNHPSRSWTGQFTAARSWLPVYKGTTLKNLQVAVIPVTIDTTRVARFGFKLKYAFGVMIDIQKWFNVNGATFTTDVDALDKTVQDMADFYQDGHEVLTGYNVVLAEREDVYDPQILYAKGTWETLIALAIQGHR